MSHRSHLLTGLTITVLAGIAACQDFLPANPYDPRAPEQEQARGSLRVALFLDDLSLDPASADVALAALTVRVRGASPATLKTARCGGDGSTVLALACDGSTRTARAVVGELQAGRYALDVEGVDPRYLPPAMPTVDLLPGEDRDLGTLRYFVPSTELQPGTGRVLGQVNLFSGDGGLARVGLHRREGASVVQVALAYADAQGGFDFRELTPGTYALSAELEGYTPDYRAGFEIQRDLVEAQNTVRFEDTQALQLYPVSAVLIPAVQQTFGQYYTRDDSIPVQVLQFGGMNEMQVWADNPAASGTLDWVPFAATADVPLPAREGVLTLLAQFRNTQVSGFTFDSGLFSTQVVRDVTPPAVLGARLRGRTTGALGRIWLNQDAVVLSVEVDGQDTVSAVYGMVLHHDAQNSAGDPLSLSFALTESPPGLVRLDDEIGLTAGEGEKKVFAYLRDRAGNTSAAVEVSAWVDTTPPAVSLVLPGAVTGGALVPVQVQASDANGVVSMQVWEEGQPVPEPLPVAELWSVQLQPLSYASTMRQINALVTDVAGNTSAMFSDTIEFDDRGALAGRLLVEDATDGSAGDAAGVTALVDGQSYTAQWAATGQRGEFDFVIAAIPAAGNRQLVMQKAGYGEVRTVARYTVLPGATTTVEALSLRLARGSIAGVARLDSGANNAGIVVSVLGTSLSAATDPLGLFRIDDVPAATGYTLVFRYDDDHSTEQRTGVQVQAGQVTQVSTEGSPVILVTLQGGVAITEGNFTNALVVHLLLSFEGAMEYRASEDPSFADTSYRAFTDAATGCQNQGGGAWRCPFTLADSDALHRVHVQFQDPAQGGFESDLRSDTITLDRVPPSTGSVELAGGAAAVRVLNVEAVVASTDDNGVALMQLSTDGSTYASPVTFHSPFPQVFTGNEGTKCLYARFVDVAGNLSALPAASDCVLYDVTPPTGSLAIVDASGQDLTITNTPGAYLQVSASGASEMRLSSRSDFAGAVWQAVNTTDRTYWPFEPGQGTRTVYLALQDLAGNVAQGQPSLQDSVQIDTQAPAAPIFTVQEGAFTNLPQINLDLANATSGDMVRFESDRAPGAVQSAPATAAVAFTLPAQDGLHLLRVTYRDPAGNDSLASTASITLDRTGPSLLGVSCATCTSVAGEVLSTQQAVTLSIQGGDAAQIRVTGAVSSSTSWQGFASLLAVTLTPGDGLKNVQVELLDAAGNASLPASRSLAIRVDSPTGGVPTTGSLVVTGVDKDGASTARTRDRYAMATSAGFGDGAQGSGLTHFQLSESSSFIGAVWQECPLSSSCNTDLPVVLSTGEGDKTLYLRVRDAAGNVSTGVPSNTLRLDTMAPSLSIVLEGQVAGGAPSNQFSRIPSVFVRVTASDAGSGLSPVTNLLKVANDAAFTAASWRNLGDVTGWTLPAIAVDGSKRVYVLVQDLAGNQTQADASIVLDTRAPASARVLIDEDAVVTGTSSNHSLTLAASDATSGLSQMCLSNTSSCSTWEAFADVKNSWALTAGAGTRTVYAWFRDAAGNEVGPVSDDIQVDLVAPSAASFTIGGFSGNCLVGGSNWVTSTGVTVTLQASDDLGITDYKLAEGSNFGAVGWSPWPGSGAGPFSVSHLLSSDEGQKTLGLRVRDAMGRTIDAATVCVTLDNAPPTLVSVEILGGEYTSSPDVTVRVTAGDSLSTGSGLKLALGNELMLCAAASYSRDFTGCTGTTCVRDFVWTLNASEGSRRVVACVQDGAGRIIGGASDTVLLDLTNPPQIVDLQLVTGSRQVTASWSVVTDVGSDVDHYELNHSPTPDFSGALAQTLDTGLFSSAEITGLDNRIPYYFRVRAVDRASLPGPWSAVRQAVLGFTPVRLGEPEHWRTFANNSFASPALSTAGGRLWLTGYRIPPVGNVTLEVYMCDPRVVDCRLAANWNRVGGDTLNVFDTGTTAPLRVPIVEAGGRIYLATLSTSAGTRALVVRMCFVDNTCLDGSDWAPVTVDTGDTIHHQFVDLVSTGSRVVLTYFKQSGSPYYPVVASCPMSKRCDAGANWDKPHLTSAPQAMPWVGGTPSTGSDGKRIWVAYRTGTTLYDVAVATCSLGTQCDATTEYNYYTLNAAVSGQSEYRPQLVVTPQRLYLSWYSTTGSYRIRLARCNISSACNSATDWTLGEFINPGSEYNTVPSLHMAYADTALHGTWWNGDEGRVNYGYCLSPDTTDCLSPDQWTTFPLDDNVLLTNEPDIAWQGHNPLVAYREDSGYVRLQMARVAVPTDVAMAPAAGEFRAAWTGLSYLDGYHLVHDVDGPPSWLNTLLLPDPLIERAQISSTPGALQVAALRAMVDGEVSDDSRAVQVQPFKKVEAVADTASFTATCGTGGSQCNGYTVAANSSTLFAAYKSRNSPFQTLLTTCAFTTKDCAQTSNWSTPFAVMQGDRFGVTLLATDNRVFVAEASNGYQTFITYCQASTGCDIASEWSTALTLNTGMWPALAWGNARVMMVTRNSAGGLRGHFCLDASNCSLTGSWTQNVVIDDAAAYTGFDLVATASGFSVVRELALDVNYRHCRNSTACDATADWASYTSNVFDTPATAPTPYSVKIAASANPALQFLTSVHEGYLWVAVCYSSSYTCYDPETWARVRLDIVTHDKGLIVQPLVAGNTLTVLYSTLNEMRLATCQQNCHTREGWHIAPVLRSPELRESFGNRPVFSVVNTDKLVIGYELDTTPAYPLSVLWDGKAVPLE
ncbi:MAG: fibronectin type III domain-containing protein [Pseudomonadota bacterium]